MLLSYKNACPAFDGEGPGILNYYTQAELSRTRGVNPNSVHAVEIPSSYIKQIRAAYLEQKKPNDDVSRRIYEDFQRSRAAPQQAGDTR